MLKNCLFKSILVLIVFLGVFYLLSEKWDSKAASNEPNAKETEAPNTTSKPGDQKESEASTKQNTGKTATVKQNGKEEKKTEKIHKKKTKADEKEKIEKEKKTNEKVKAGEKLNSRKINSILSDSLISGSDGYFEVTENNPVRVFAEDRKSGFGMKTLSWYNLWGNSAGTCTYNMSKLKKHGKTLHMRAGLEDGGSGTVTVEFYMDKTTDESPDYTFEINAETVPEKIEIDIENVNSMTIRMDNKSANRNNIVFYGMSLS